MVTKVQAARAESGTSTWWPSKHGADNQAGALNEITRGCRFMGPISFAYTNAPLPSRGADRVCFVIAVAEAAGRTLDFARNPKLTDGCSRPCTAWHRRASERPGAHRE